MGSGTDIGPSRPVRHRTGRWLTALVLAAALAGCADTTADPPAAEQDPVPEPVGEFRSEADQLCQALAVDSEEVRRDEGELDTPAAQVRHLGELATIRVEFAADIAGLDPDGLADTGGEAGRESGPGVAEDLSQAADRRAEISLEAEGLGAEELEPGRGGEKRIEKLLRADRRAEASMVRAAEVLGLEECALQLDPVALDEIRDALTEALTAGEASERCEWIGSRLLGAEFGDEPGCVTAMETDEPAGAVEILEMRGVADVYAEGRARIEGGPNDGTREVRVTFERGRYRIDRIG